MHEVDHIGVVVEDSERSCSFYVEVLGYEVLERAQDERLKAVYLKKGSQVIELLEYLTPGRQERRTGKIDHIAFKVDDLERTVAGLRGKGIDFLQESPRTVFGGKKRVMFFTGPDGERLELIQYME